MPRRRGRPERKEPAEVQARGTPQARLQRRRGPGCQQRGEGPRGPEEDIQERGDHRLQVQRGDRQHRVRLQGNEATGTRGHEVQKAEPCAKNSRRGPHKVHCHHLRRQQGQKARKRHRRAPIRRGPQRQRRGAGSIQERDRQGPGIRHQEPAEEGQPSRYDETITRRGKAFDSVPRQ